MMWSQFRLWVAGVVVPVFLAGLTAGAHAEVGGKLKVSTWDGAYKLSQQKAFFEPYRAETGTAVKVSVNENPLDQLKKWKNGSRAAQDVVNLTSYQAERACNEGLLASLTAEDIASGDDGDDLSKDFLGNSLMDCAVPNVAWSALLAVKNDAFKKKKPRTLGDFFNIKKFPGKRSLKKSGRYTMEMALMAAGVKPQDVYETLATIKGQKRAFKMLDRIKGESLWWETSAEAIANLESSDVVMGVAYNGRLFNAIVRDSLDVTLVWQGQVYDHDYWGIPVKAANREAAMDFVKFATAPERLAAQSKWMPYGPMRDSALEFVGNHDLIDVHMSAYLPTTKAHFRRALKLREGWWLSAAGREVEGRFNSWMSGTLTWPDENSDR